ncbi:MAG: NTP transferase domain-containing protein [Woeseia sp.]
MPVNDTVWGLVLAGGESRRMGSDKALLERDGVTQLSRAVGLLERHVARTFVSTRAEQSTEQERRRFEQIVDRYNGIGPVAGILSALEQHPDVCWLVLACDLPNVDDATIGFLLRNRSGDKPFTAFTSSYDELPEPLCAVYRPESRAIIRDFLDVGLDCPRKMLIRSDTELLQQPNPSALDNVNTPDDLVRTGMKVAS